MEYMTYTYLVSLRMIGSMYGLSPFFVTTSSLLRLNVDWSKSHTDIKLSYVSLPSVKSTSMSMSLSGRFSSLTVEPNKPIEETP